jgi:hypothetical protein
MKRNWNVSLKWMLMCSVAALLAATSAFALPKGSDGKPEGGCEDTKSGPYAFNYAKDIGLSAPSDFFVYGEFLWLKAQEEGLEYAISQTSTTSLGGAAFPLQGGNVLGFSNGTHDWDWNPGFRVGFGYYMNHDAWCVNAYWTYIRIKNDKNSTKPSNGVLLPLWMPAYLNFAGDDTACSHASERWTGKFNTLDIMMGKPFHPSRFFILQPFFGIRAAWIDQDIIARYTLSDTVKMIAKNDFWGVGLRGGFESEYLMGCGWNLFGHLSTSMLYGKFDTSQQLGYGTYGNYELDQDFYKNNPNLEMKLGISWGQFFAKNTYHVSLKVAYEFHQWFKQNQLRRFLDGGAANTPETAAISSNMPVNGDLSFNGFSFRLQFDF